MSIKPIDIAMVITQSQTVKTPDFDHDIKHAHQTEILSQQNTKNRESVPRIPDETETDSMATIKQGLPDSNAETFSEHHHQQHHHSEELDIPEKALLDDSNGHSLDIIG